ncbi:hypothetical protein L5515_009397 [Caenorhabditis briggsae]|uniref:Uncharacterized protein n=2 Tax=Caenorhabditis briggsae TaxID=6238 RepID=A0AAE9JNN0_CAEBR|nr:hypothetical protein L5515_009397 [Caenorhabditis briggsae]
MKFLLPIFLILLCLHFATSSGPDFTSDAFLEASNHLHAFQAALTFGNVDSMKQLITVDGTETQEDFDRFFGTFGKMDYSIQSADFKKNGTLEMNLKINGKDQKNGSSLKFYLNKNPLSVSGWKIQSAAIQKSGIHRKMPDISDYIICVASLPLCLWKKFVDVVLVIG